MNQYEKSFVSASMSNDLGAMRANVINLRESYKRNVFVESICSNIKHNANMLTFTYLLDLSKSYVKKDSDKFILDSLLKNFNSNKYELLLEKGIIPKNSIKYFKKELMVYRFRGDYNNLDKIITYFDFSSRVLIDAIRSHFVLSSDSRYYVNFIYVILKYIEKKQTKQRYEDFLSYLSTECDDYIYRYKWYDHHYIYNYIKILEATNKRLNEIYHANNNQSI